MLPPVDLALFLPFLEQHQLILTPGKRLARDIRRSWVTQQQSDCAVVVTPRIEALDGWLEGMWSECIELGRLAESAAVVVPTRIGVVAANYQRGYCDTRGLFINASSCRSKSGKSGPRSIANVPEPRAWMDCGATSSSMRTALFLLDGRNSLISVCPN